MNCNKIHRIYNKSKLLAEITIFTTKASGIKIQESRIKKIIRYNYLISILIINSVIFLIFVPSCLGGYEFSKQEYIGITYENFTDLS